MKIAIFENEYPSVKGAFDTANLLYFENKLEIDVFPSSQNADMRTISNYKVIFIDIDLSSKSLQDGFALIQKIESIDMKLLANIIILTGNNKISEALELRNINPKSIKIIIKPTNYKEIGDSIQLIINNL